MAAEALRSEFLCSLTGLVAPPRDIGTTPRGTRRFYPAIGGSFEGPRLRGEVLLVCRFQNSVTRFGC